MESQRDEEFLNSKRHTLYKRNETSILQDQKLANVCSPKRRTFFNLKETQIVVPQRLKVVDNAKFDNHLNTNNRVVKHYKCKYTETKNTLTRFR